LISRAAELALLIKDKIETLSQKRQF